MYHYCYCTGFAVTIGDAYKDNDDGVEREIVDIIQIKTVLKFMSVMSVKFALYKNY